LLARLLCEEKRGIVYLSMGDVIKRIESNGKVGFILPDTRRSLLDKLLDDIGGAISAGGGLLAVAAGIFVAITLRQPVYLGPVLGLVLIVAGLAAAKNGVVAILPHHSEVWVDVDGICFRDVAGPLRRTTRFRRSKVVDLSAFSFATMLAQGRDAGQLAGRADFDPKKYQDGHIVVALSNGRRKELLAEYPFPLIEELAGKLRMECGFGRAIADASNPHQTR
jgi:hypothetical protein